MKLIPYFVKEQLQEHTDRNPSKHCESLVHRVLGWVDNIVKEIRNLGNKIDKLEKIVETSWWRSSRQVWKKTLSEFERKRKTGKLEFLPLS